MRDLEMKWDFLSCFYWKFLVFKEPNASVLANFICVRRTMKNTVLLRRFNPTYITASFTHSTTSELSHTQEVHTHTAILKRAGCNLEVVPQLSIKEKKKSVSFSVRNLLLHRKLNSCWWQIHCWRQWRTITGEGRWLLMSEADVWQAAHNESQKAANLQALPRTAESRFHQSILAEALATHPSYFGQKWPETQKTEFIYIYISAHTGQTTVTS